MTSNTIFIILTSILIIAVLIYLIGVKKGKSKSASQITSMQTPGTVEEDDDDDDEKEL